MKARSVSSWVKIMAGIAAASAPIASGACGGQVEGGETSGGGPSLSSSSGGASSSSGASGASGASGGTSGGKGCGGSLEDEVPWSPPRCETVLDEAGASDGGPDADVDGGSSGTVVCESERDHCMRLCEDADWNGYPSRHAVRVSNCAIREDSRGKHVFCAGNMPPCGRAHEGLAPAPTSDEVSPVARWLENAAYLEDASVTSFELLAKELAAHGAPPALVAKAKKSARDEVRHARVMGALAQRHGGRAPRAAKLQRRPRALAEMLRENAIEGCVNETYGAQLAWYQATRASDPKVKAAMKRIAADETAHASLAWAIARWGEARLDETTRADVEAARAAAWRELERSLAHEPEDELVATVGLPTAAVARTMLRRLSRAAFAIYRISTPSATSSSFASG